MHKFPLLADTVTRPVTDWHYWTSSNYR